MRPSGADWLLILTCPTFRGGSSNLNQSRPHDFRVMGSEFCCVFTSAGFIWVLFPPRKGLRVLIGGMGPARRDD